MRKIFTLLTFAFFSGSALQAQTVTGKVGGSVLDGSGKSLEMASVVLLRAKDSSLVKMAAAGKEGRFSFEELKEGGYLVSATAVGHGKSFSPVFEISTAQHLVSLQPLQLKPVSKDLGAVTVTARKALIEQKIDRTVVNVDASPTNAGATALEVLEKSPGVSVDKDGNISLKGKQGVQVMMDGRPAYLSGTELSNYLRNLPASAIEQIEIMTNPSSKYDAAGNSGIINIKTKKNKQKGFNGNIGLNYSQGFYHKTNNSFNMNYRSGKVNLFANGSYSEWNSFNELSIDRRFSNAETKQLEAIFNQSSRMVNRNKNYNVKAGADFFLTKKTTIGIVSNGFMSPSRFNSRNTSFLKNKDNVVDSIVTAVSNNQSTWKNGSVNLNLRHQFDSTGRELTADLDYITYDANSSQDFTSTNYTTNWSKKNEEKLRGALPLGINIYTARADYAQPLNKTTKLEAGVKTGFVRTDNTANYYNVFGNTEIPDYRKINHFLYSENINAAYVNMNRQMNKWGVQAGLRFESTRYTGKQNGNPERKDSTFTNEYANLFPTLYVSYKANDKNTLAVSYGRRIDRPAYQDLNPFLDFIDAYTYNQGNPFLKPQFSNNIELTHIFGGMLTTTLNYSHTKDLRAETFEQGQNLNGTNGYATIVKRGNLGQRQTAGVSVSLGAPVAKWWQTNIYTNFNHTVFSGRINNSNEFIDISASNLMLNVNNTFKFKGGWSAELSGWYRTKGVEGQILIQPMGQMNAGIGKQIIKGKGTLRLNVRDFLKTNYARGDINFQNTEAHFENRRDSRVGTLSFTYRFGKPIKGQQQRRKIGGADDEQSRVKVGGGN